MGEYFKPSGGGKVDGFSDIEAPVEASVVSATAGDDEFTGILGNSGRELI